MSHTNGMNGMNGTGELDRLRCSTFYKNGLAEGMRQCSKPVRWLVGKARTPFCNGCFDKWAETHWEEFDPETIERLSDDERDFGYEATKTAHPNVNAEVRG